MLTASGSSCSSGDRAVAPDQAPQRGPLEVLDQHVGVGPIEHRVEAAHQHRVRERGERLGLELEVAERLLLLGPVRAQDLGDGERVERFVPDEADLVEVAAAERLQHDPARHSSSPSPNSQLECSLILQGYEHRRSASIT